MDLSLFCTGDQTRSLQALLDGQTVDSDSPCPTEKSSFGAETASGPSEPSDKSNFSKGLSREKTHNSDCLNPSSSSCDVTLCSESEAKDDACTVCSYSDPSEPALPLLPHFTHDLSSPQSESEFYVQNSEHETSTPQPSWATSSTSEGTSEPLSSSDLNQATSLMRSLSHQSDSLESDAATALVPDLFIFESETRGFVLSPHVDPEEITGFEYQPLLQTEGGEAVADRVLACDSEDAVTRCAEEGAMPDDESDVSQRERNAPAVDAGEAGWMSGNDAGRGKEEVADVTPRLRRSDSPIELWLDACQYLAGEEAEDRTGHSVMQGGLSVTGDFPPRETQVSGYHPDGDEGIGWSDDDTIGWGPPVERWSSVDSWASALSDWTGIIAAPSEDLTAAFTEIGAEIDALRQALAEVNTHTGTEGREPGAQAQTQPPMGVQDQPLKAQNIPQSSELSGQGCLSLCIQAERLQDGEASGIVQCFCDTTATAQEESETDDIQTPFSIASMGATVASPGGYGLDATTGSTSSSADLSDFGGYVDSFETDSFGSSDQDPIILNIIEDTDLEGQDAPAELQIEKPFAGGLCEVTDEHSVSQLAAQEAARSSGPLEADRKETGPSADLRFLTAHHLTGSHVPGVDTQPGLRVNVAAHVSPDTSPDFDGARQLEPQLESPKFIMPLAPLCVGSSLACQTSSNLRGDQTSAKRSLNDNRDFSRDHVRPCIPWPTSGGIAHKPGLESDAELIHKKEESAGKSSPEGQPDTTDSFFPARKTLTEEVNDISRELSHLISDPADHFFISKKNRVAVITLDINDPFVPRAIKPIGIAVKAEETAPKMPHKTNKPTSENKPRTKKDKSAAHHHGAQASKKQENVSHHASAQQVCKQQESHPVIEEHSESAPAGLKDKEAKPVAETAVAAEKAPGKPHGKKKKKHAQNATGVKSGGEAEADNGAKAKTAKGRIDMFEAKLGGKAGKAQKDIDQAHGAEKKQPDAKASQGEQSQHQSDHKGQQTKNFPLPLKDDIKRRRLSEDKFGKIVSVLESKLPKPDVSIQAKGDEPKADAGAASKKPYSEVVKQKIPPKEELKVVKPIQVEAVSADPQSLCLWCQFSAAFSNCSVTWSRDGTVLAEIKRSAGDESRVSLTISSASHKDLGKYQCRLTGSHGSIALDYLLTYEVLSEIVIPPSPQTISPPVQVGSEEEDVKCSRLLFKENFLSDQFFGENQSASIITEKVHFGEGMHRRAFRTKLHAGRIPLLVPGHSCVLKVHNSISYGTKSNDELVQKNFSLAVEECQVQNTAREYIKAYTTAAQSVETFGEIPEIIPIYLVHRPSNDIPYATLEEELIGDFVKYSVKDGKEINLMRRDSEAGQKCCAFQHWVYHKTEGNLLVTDMQGVGMRLTDVGIATCKKGYNGFKGNCATSFIDQFKVLHQCNKYCEILGLKSLQPKPKKPANALKPKPQPCAAPKKKTFGPTVKGKS